jgi:hypothetical protein
MVLDCDAWHNTNMSCGIFGFLSKLIKNQYLGSLVGK